MRRPILLPTAALALLPACEEGTHLPSWSGEVRDSAGIVIVENSLDGLWPEEGGWELQEELRIGGLNAPLPYQFGQVGSIAVGSRGQIYVADMHAQEVRVFSEAGDHTQAIGSPGS